MKVKIIKCSTNGWYSNCIGFIFNVVNCGSSQLPTDIIDNKNPDQNWIPFVDLNNLYCHFILKSDCTNE